MNYWTAIIALDREKSARLDWSYIMIFVIFYTPNPSSLYVRILYKVARHPTKFTLCGILGRKKLKY